MTKGWAEFRKAGAEAVQAGQLDQAEDLWFSALQEAESFEDGDRRLQITLEDLASLYWHRNKYAQAAAVCKRILKRNKDTLGPSHTDTLTVCSNLAMIYHSAGMLEEAEGHYKEVLTKGRESMPSGDLANVQYQYMGLLRETGRADLADKLASLLGEQQKRKWKRSGVYEAFVQENPKEPDHSLHASSESQSEVPEKV